jgi:hypothetical protein
LGQPHPDGLYLARHGKVPVALVSLKGARQGRAGFNLSMSRSKIMSVTAELKQEIIQDNARAPATPVRPKCRLPS